MQRLLGFRPEFQGQRNHLAQWATTLQAEPRPSGRAVELKDKAILRWTDSMDTMVVTFGEVASGAHRPRQTPVLGRRARWQIIYEGVIG
jgi:hypothetical protein